MFNRDVNVCFYDIFSTSNLFDSCFCVCVCKTACNSHACWISFICIYVLFWREMHFFQQYITLFDRLLACSLSYEKPACFCFIKYILKFVLQIKYVDKPYSTFIRILTLAIWMSFEFKMFTNILLEMLKILEFRLLNRLHKLLWTHWLPIQQD